MIVRRLAILAAVLVLAGVVIAQPPAKKGEAESKKGDPKPKEPAKPAPGSLEDTLDKALRSSGDIRAAEAKVRESEAELNRVRQQVLTKATALHADLNVAKRMLVVAEQSNNALQTAPGKGESMLAARAMAEKYRGEVEKLETELKSLRGEFAIRPYGNASFAAFSDDLHSIRAQDMSRGSFELRWMDEVYDLASRAPKATAPAPPSIQPAMLERVKKLLDQEIEFAVGNVSISDSMEKLMELANSDVPVRDLYRAGDGGTVTIAGKLTVGAIMQAIEDSDPNVQIVVRDYGLLLTTRERVPSGAVRVQDLWKGTHVKEKKSTESNPPK
jgi:hypothetical protein